MMVIETLPEMDAVGSPFLSESQRSWLKKARDFADSIPIEECIASDVDNTFRRDLFERACKEGLGALPFPATYGGSGGDYVSFVLVNEEFARRCVPIMSSLGVHVLCQEPIYRFGTDEQKKKYLTPSSSGQYLAAFGLTEPGAGSDTAAIATTAKLVGNEYVLNGTKTFITSGASADYYIVMARVMSDQPSTTVPAPEKEPSATWPYSKNSAEAVKPRKSSNPQTITAFVVERNFPGFEIGQKFNMLGMRGYSTCEIVFNDCKVPTANMLGALGQGRTVALGSLAKGRVTIAAQATGWAQGCLDALRRYVAARRDKLAAPELQALLTKIGEIATMIESARVLTFQAACAIDRAESDVVLAGMAKIQATDVAMKTATEVMTLMGLDGLDPRNLVERIFRDAKAGQIYEGTNQIQRMLIARSLTRES